MLRVQRLRGSIRDRSTATGLPEQIRRAPSLAGVVCEVCGEWSPTRHVALDLLRRQEYVQELLRPGCRREQRGVLLVNGGFPTLVVDEEGRSGLVLLGRPRDEPDREQRRDRDRKAEEHLVAVECLTVRRVHDSVGIGLGDPIACGSIVAGGRAEYH